MRKCQLYGLRVANLALLRDYPRNIEQCIHIYEFSLSKSLVHCGVPQGSLLGPTFLFFFINQLPSAVATNSRIRDILDPAPSESRITTPFLADGATLMCVASTEQQLTSTINAAMTKTCID